MRLLSGKQEFYNMKKKRKVNSGFFSEITEPLIYLKNKTGYDSECFTVSEVMTKNFGTLRMSEFEKNTECCTLVASYNVLQSYLNTEKPAIKGEQNAELVTRKADEPAAFSPLAVRKEAKRFFYRPSWGLSIIMNAPLLISVMRKHLGRKHGWAKMRLFPSKKSLMKRIDKGHPFVYSLASGFYFNHSVTVIGYKTYTNQQTGKAYTFLVLNDGWSFGTRYLAWKGTGAFYISCATFVSHW